MKRLLVVVAVAALLGTTTGNPTSAAEPNVGGGTLTGTMAFGGNGIPRVNTPCRQVTFTFDAFATVAIQNLSGSNWVGTIGNPQARTGVTGSGSSTCENATVGGGAFAVNAIRVLNPNTTGILDCHGLAGSTAPLIGSYTRTLTDMFAVVGGQCTLNHGATENVAIAIRAELVPFGTPGDGVTASITSALMAAAFTVVPAGSPVPGS